MNMLRQKYGTAVAIICIAGSLAGCTYCAAVLATIIANYAANRIAAGLTARGSETPTHDYWLQGEQV